jgi:hypothetical protein
MSDEDEIFSLMPRIGQSADEAMNEEPPEPAHEPVVAEVPMQLMDITDAHLWPDPDNARLHTPENLDAIGWSLDEVGGARSIVIDDDNVIRAGNGTYEMARRRGMKLLIVDRPSKDTLIAVRVSGLDDREKRRLALWDNRAAELAKWNRRVLKKLAAPDQGLLEGLFDDATLADLKGEQAKQQERYGTSMQFECPQCGYGWSGAKKPPRTRAPEELSAVQTTLPEPEGS